MRRKRPDLDEQLDRFERALPRWASRWLHWLRKPGLKWLRIPAGLLLIASGFLWFLPIVGLWMLPLGLMLLAVDIPFLRGPVARLIDWGQRKWKAWTGNAPANRRRQTIRSQ
jgi:hypothetical protein